jgi:intraflagellar transport protein 172
LCKISKISQLDNLLSGPFPRLDDLRRNFYTWLLDSSQEEKAGEMKEKEGDHIAAINLYLRAGLPAKAAALATSKDEILRHDDVVQVTNRIKRKE